ncbi:hypothetical protein HYN48_08635 [Flavobacterium magnum]|uniref:DUF6265 domain-containing protein n=1 Tax=Flavobacterium magnum TaxID=2162713 RepID=A0A2S0RFR6_9FLAO|nr:DUF6265 family protein [Flavobacterium magnum]AWA30140.1 hypothetical protein HYN48_08635 [Flavobacterium magnum]
MIRKTFAAIALCAVISSCKNERRYDRIENAKWLIGRWENDSRAGKLVEEWSTFNDSMIIGSGMFVTGTDTVFSEDLWLEQHGDSLSYFAKVYGQNNSRKVEFKMTSSTKDQMVFENPTHDFPNKIVYRHVQDSLIADVSGVSKGQPKTEHFAMKKK